MLIQTRSAHEIAIEALAEALDARDSYTAGHGVRVADLAAKIGEHMGIPRSQIHALRLGGRLHDIGKVGIPDSILLKASGLSDHESGVMRGHTLIGRRIIASLGAPADLLAAVELHHENWNGSGYPHGLKAEDIPLIARIVRLADSFDAMTTHRVYRPAFDLEHAIEQIRAGSGRYYDPSVVEAFEHVREAIRIEARSEELAAVPA